MLHVDAGLGIAVDRGPILGADQIGEPPQIAAQIEDAGHARGQHRIAHRNISAAVLSANRRPI